MVQKRTARVALLLIVLVGSLGSTLAVQLLLGHSEVSAQSVEPDQRQRVAEAVTWLVQTHQNADGGYSAFSSGADVAPSDVGGTVDALLALGASGYNPAAPYPERENTPIGYLLENPELVANYAGQDGGSAGKLILALSASGQDVRSFGDFNLVISLTAHLSPTGQFGVSNAFNQSLALLALSAVNEPTPESAVAWLLELQQPDGEFAGSWDDGFGTLGNTDATAMAVMALLSAGFDPESAPIAGGRDFLARTQLAEGGWAYGPGLPESANSTALTLQALSALGEDFYSDVSPFAKENGSPLDVLMSWQGENGAFQSDFGSGPFDDFFATVQSTPALTGRSYPLPARHEAARLAVSCLASLQDPNSGGWESFASGGVDAGGTARAIVALVAYGEDPSGEAWQVAGSTPLEALEALTLAYLAEGRGGRVGTVLRGVVAAGGDESSFAGYDLPISITNYLSPTGEYDDTSFGPFGHNQAILGLLAAGEPVDPPALDWLRANTPEQGWADADSNGTTLRILASQGDQADALLAVLRATQLPDGGWGFSETASPSSTSEAVQGIAQAGENPFSPAWSTVLSGTIHNPADTVMQLQDDQGCWPSAFGPGSDPYGTTDAIQLLVQTLPWGAPFAQTTDEGSGDGSVREAPTGSEPEATVLAETSTATALPEMTETVVPASTATIGAEAIGQSTGSETPESVAERTDEEDEPDVSPELAGDESSPVAAVNPVVAWLLILVAIAALVAAYLWWRRGE